MNESNKVYIIEVGKKWRFGRQPVVWRYKRGLRNRFIACEPNQEEGHR
jgi:hypothetical protein